MSYSVQNIRNVCLLGHSGSGKTALTESLLYMTGAIDRMGRVADGNTVCDYDPEEIKRQISGLPAGQAVSRCVQRPCDYPQR